MSIFNVIGLFFVGLFNAAKKAYNKLSDDQKDALQSGVGLIAILNENIEKAPAEVRLLIQAKFPKLNEQALETGLFSVAQSFGITQFSNLEEAIVAVQGHLNSLEGKAWAVASHSAAALLSVLFAPTETKVAAIVSLLEWVYQHFIKKATGKE